MPPFLHRFLELGFLSRGMLADSWAGAGLAVVRNTARLLPRHWRTVRCWFSAVAAGGRGPRRGAQEPVLLPLCGHLSGHCVGRRGGADWFFLFFFFPHGSFKESVLYLLQCCFCFVFCFFGLEDY